MTEREMLEFAALAMGWQFQRMTDDGKAALLFGWHSPWNPIQNSADCLEMAAALDIHAEWRKVSITVWISEGDSVRAFYRAHDDNKVAAYRMAATRLAAEIGQRMANETTEG